MPTVWEAAGGSGLVLEGPRGESSLTGLRKRSFTWQTREDGMVDFRAHLPAEEAATLIAAITAAKDQFGALPERPAGQPAETATGNAEGGYSSADAVLDVARVFLDTAPEERSGEYRNLVVVHVSAENLASSGAENVHAGTFRRLEAAAETDQVTYDVPATKGSEEAKKSSRGNACRGADQ